MAQWHKDTKTQRHKDTKTRIRYRSRQISRSKYRLASIAAGKYHEVNIAKLLSLPTQNVIEPLSFIGYEFDRLNNSKIKAWLLNSIFKIQY